MIETDEKVADTITIAEAYKWLAMGYEFEIDNGEVTKIRRRKAPHVVEEHEAAV